MASEEASAFTISDFQGDSKAVKLDFASHSEIHRSKDDCLLDLDKFARFSAHADIIRRYMRIRKTVGDSFRAASTLYSFGVRTLENLIQDRKRNNAIAPLSLTSRANPSQYSRSRSPLREDACPDSAAEGMKDLIFRQ